MKNMEYKNLRQLRMFVKATMQELPYHGFAHADEVVRTSERLGTLEGIDSEGMGLLMAGAYLHDVIYVVGKKDNEEASALVAKDFLRTLYYKPAQIETVSGLILATKMPTNPKNLLEQIIGDADVDNLGREDFMEKCEALRQEAGVADKIIWYNSALKFLEGHKFYTESAKRLRQEGLEDNKRYLGNWLKLNGKG